MGEEENRGAVERLWAAFERKDFDAVDAELADDFSEEYPQSGERIAGKENFLAMARAFEGFPTVKVLRIVGREDLWVTEATFEYPGLDGPPWQVVEVQEVRDGRVARIRALFGAPFEPAEWRAPYVEKM